MNVPSCRQKADSHFDKQEQEPAVNTHTHTPGGAIGPGGPRGPGGSPSGGPLRSLSHVGEIEPLSE